MNKETQIHDRELNEIILKEGNIVNQLTEVSLRYFRTHRYERNVLDFWSNQMPSMMQELLPTIYQYSEEQISNSWPMCVKEIPPLMAQKLASLSGITFEYLAHSYLQSLKTKPFEFIELSSSFDGIVEIIDQTGEVQVSKFKRGAFSSTQINLGKDWIIIPDGLILKDEPRLNQKTLAAITETKYGINGTYLMGVHPTFNFYQLLLSNEETTERLGQKITPGNNLHLLGENEVRFILLTERNFTKEAEGKSRRLGWDKVIRTPFDFFDVTQKTAHIIRSQRVI